MNSLPVLESFITIQGEGFFTGHLAYFIRLAGCDVGCTWCDVKESWPVEDNQYQDIEQIVSDAQKHHASIVVITGGEPLMYDLNDLCDALHKAGMRVHIETSGAYPLSGVFDWICLSPKKFKLPLKDIYKVADELKVIVVNKHDLTWALEQAENVKGECKLFLQAEWSKKDKVYADIYSFIRNQPNWQISVQTHKYLGLP